MKQFKILFFLVFVTCEVRCVSSFKDKYFPVTAELEGTFKFKGGLKQKFDIHGNIKLNKNAQRKRGIEKSGLEFNGTLTLRKGAEVVVIGAHANFEAEDRSVKISNDIDTAEDTHLEGNRLRRSPSYGKTIIGFYGKLNLQQFALPTAIGIDASLSLQNVRNPNFVWKLRKEGVNEKESDEAEIRGTLKIATVQINEKLDVLFSLVLKDQGLKTQEDREDEIRFKRGNKEMMLVTNIEGSFEPENWQVFILFKGEVSLWDLYDKNRPTPKQKFIERVGDEVILYEMDANLTTKTNGREYVTPVQSDMLIFDAKRTTLKREVDKNKMIEFSFDAEIQSRRGAQDDISTCVLNADIELWKISTTNE